MRASQACLSAALLAGALASCAVINVDSSPPGAKVYLNGQLLGTTPFVHTFWAGQDTHSISEVVLPGYKREDCTYLDRPAGIPWLMLTSAPKGGKFYVDGMPVGETPLFTGQLWFPKQLKVAWSQQALLAAGSGPQQTTPPPAAQLAPSGPVRNRFAVVIGLSRYKFRGKWKLSNLRYAADDAKAFAKYLQSERGGRFDQVFLLTDEQATTRNIKIAMRERLRGVQKDDLLVIYWSGHGGADPHDLDSLYLITHDTDPEHMPSTAYAMEEFKGDIGRLQSQRVLILADTCHSAGISDPKIGLKGPQENRIVEGIKGVYVAAEAPAPASPLRMIFTSCESGEYSLESGKLGNGHGVFTWFLLEALGGRADNPKYGGDGDSKVTLGEVIEYTRDRVKRFTGNQQHPDTAGRFDRTLIMGEVE